MARDPQTVDSPAPSSAPSRPPQPSEQQTQSQNASEQQQARTTEQSSVRAVCVGVNNYAGLNALPGCVADAQAFSAMLRMDYGATDVTVFTDDQANAVNVTAALKHICQNCSPNDRLVFFYSGHGYSSMRNGILEQNLVLKGGSQGFDFFYGDQLAQLTQGLPPGCLTVILDCCFSGGMYKQLVMPVSRGPYVAECAKVKAWTPVNSKELDASIGADLAAESIRPFGEGISIRVPPSADPLQALALKGFRTGLAGANTGTDKVTRLVLNGLLMSACRDDQTAASSTSQTDGKSAYTFCLLQALTALGPNTTAQALDEEIARRLQALGLQQTPILKEPVAPPNLAQRPFVTLAAPVRKTFGTAAAQGQPVGWQQLLVSLDEALNQRQSKNLNERIGAPLMNPLLTLLLANQGNSQTQQGQSQNDLVKALILSQAFSSTEGNNQRQQTRGFDISSILPILLSQRGQQSQRGYANTTSTSNASQVLLACAAAAPDQKAFWEDCAQVVATVAPAVIGAL